MKTLDRTILKIFLYGLPLAVILALFSSFYQQGSLQNLAVFKFLHSFAGLIISVWMTLTLYLSVRLIASQKFRNIILTKMTFMKERDERESHLTGKATKTAFLMSLALLILLFFLSCFQISVYRLPAEKAVNGKTGTISLGINLNLFNNTVQEEKETHAQDIFGYTSLPLSSTGVILLLMIWNLGWYNYSIRRAI